MMRTTHSWLLALTAVALFTCGLPTEQAMAQNKQKTVRHYVPGGHLFVSQRPFPLNAEDDKGLIRNGRKNQQSRLKWSSGDELRFQMLIVLKRKFGAKQLYLVLYKQGEKDYKDARNIPVKSSMQRLVSWVTFSGEYLKRGTQYELRAIRISKRGSLRVEHIVAKTKFRL